MRWDASATSPEGELVVGWCLCYEVLELRQRKPQEEVGEVEIVEWRE